MSTHYILLDKFANSLSLSPEFSQVVIAGSHIFKIFSIEDGELTEKGNLYTPTKNLQQYFSSSDVVWNPMKDTKLATVSMNGSVVTWDLKKSTKSKIDQIFKDHERSVNKVNFHPQEAHLLISGSNGGHMKLFDTRMKEAVSTFIGNAGNVRDIQFSPHNLNCFAAGTEDGIVQLWDKRRTDRTDLQFTGHREPVFALDWHPEEKRWIATASRDREIKVWDLDDTSTFYKSIRTVDSVGRVKWRPNNKYHLASCALNVDCSISVWDIRRSYIPFAAFYEHTDVATGICWQGNGQILLSVGKDSTLYHHCFGDASHPTENMNPCALDVSTLGTVSYAKPSNENRITAGKSIMQKRSNISVGPVLSTMNTFDLEKGDSPLSVTYIVELAKKYRFFGGSIHELCEHNANVSKQVHKLEFAATWQMLQIMFGGGSTTGGSLGYSQPLFSKDDPRNDGISQDIELKPVAARHLSGETLGDFIPGVGGLSGEEAETETDDAENHEAKLVDIASGDSIAHDFFFGDDDLSHNFEFDNLNLFDRLDNFGLPNEAFQPRRDIVFESTTPPDDFAPSNNSKETMQLNDEFGSNCDYVMSASLQLLDMTISSVPFDFAPAIVDLLHYYANRGEVQMAVTIYIVVRDRIKNLIDEAVLEHWFFSYLEILHRFSLWNIATLIINNAHGIPGVQEMNKQSTDYRVVCGNCDQSISSRPRIPSKKNCQCSNGSSRCSVCQCIVQGLFVWCQGCSHGGHLNHIMEWMADHQRCPAGCGHYCQYT